MADDQPAGIDIRALESVEQIFTASEVLSEVWGGDRTGMPPNLLRALAHSGNYAVGLFDGDRMIGASAAWFAAPAERSMHSHITRQMRSSPSRMRLDQGTSGYDAVSAGSVRFSGGVGRITSSHSPAMRTWPKATEPPVEGTRPMRQWSLDSVRISGIGTFLRIPPPWPTYSDRAPSHHI